MLGLDDYGSGSESDEPTQKELQKPSVSKTAKPKKKITIGLPALKPAEEDELKDERPPAKRPRLETGKGSSALFSMLPAPKQKDPISQPTERVLGGGKGPSLVFGASPSSSAAFGTQSADEDITNSDNNTSSKSTSLLPPSLGKGRSNISLDGPAKKPPAVTAAPPVDFFSLGSSTRSRATNIVSPSTSTLSAAPTIPDFKPPEPSMTDPYPGYYQLPSGAWAAHDPEHYESFRKKWEKEYNDHVRALEKGTIKGFEGADGDDVQSVDAAQEMEKAKREITEREERKAVTKVAQGEPAKPKMNVTAAKMSGVARSRHQLATLLSEAYQNREALEEKIAEGRRNRKEAGNKYGF
ncbi:hypothetical protein K435DRAFT_286159 [Dendrothele bispora CBS 962.96]|uniref:Mitotic checkpoint regulator, MAD2B-interacting-domain-containing protein n=1 Tax=Dendrothele bispora (strain CBS 962.96) TaxID=1314807 RepID=A0A4S8LKS3_DENBC|nr:hypothetical protein K435DRAFT_286159 [Dendrothele bispora CBS 962.96]